MTDNPDYLTLYRQEADPVRFEPVFNQEMDFGEPGPHIGVRMRNPHLTHQDYLRYVLNQLPVEKAAAKTWIKRPESFAAYVWQPIPHDPAEEAYQQIPRQVIDHWANWHLHYLSLTKALFFHERA